MKKIKAGIIGIGFIGPAHVEALRRLGTVDVVALADINKKIAEEKSKTLNIPKAYGDYRKLINNDEIEIIHICAPNNLHYMIAKEALAAGKHVICEKPLAMSSEEALELVKLANERKLVNAVHFNVRFYPLVHHAKEMVEKGILGKIFAINGSYQQDWLFFDTDYSWRLDPKFSGESRAIADIGSHWFDTVEFITGIEIIKVCADFATFYPTRRKPLKDIETYSGKILEPSDYKDVSISTEDYATVLLRFKNGSHGSLTVNQVAAGRKNRIYFEIYGSKASIVYNSERPNEMWIGYREKNNEVIMKDPSLVYEKARNIIGFPGGHNEAFPDTTKQMFSKIYKYIEDRNYIKETPPEFPTFKSGLRELKICEAVVDSAKNEKWVSLGK